MDMKITPDPQGAYEGVKPTALVRAAGLLPHFALSVYYTKPETVQEAFDLLKEEYGYAMGQKGDEWGTVDSEGMYKSKYKEDPDMAPMVAMALTEDITFYVYQHAITAVTDGKTTLMMRMD
jgi:hypothetical protein